MDLQNIQDQLNTEFSKGDTRIIFWFDDKGEYDDLDLEANKIDEKGEGDILEEEDDEPDPEWGDEEIDVKKEGYFDETGAYKLKQP